MFTFGRISRRLRHVSMERARGGRGGALQVVGRPFPASTAPHPPRPARRDWSPAPAATLHIDRGTNARVAIHCQLRVHATWNML